MSHSPHIYMYISLYIYICRIYICICIEVHIYMSLYMYRGTYRYVAFSATRYICIEVHIYMSLYMYRGTYIYVARYICIEVHIDMLHSLRLMSWDNSNYICDITHSYMWHVSSVYVTWLNCMCDMPHDSILCVTCPITQPNVWRNHVCDMPHDSI